MGLTNASRREFKSREELEKHNPEQQIFSSENETSREKKYLTIVGSVVY